MGDSAVLGQFCAIMTALTWAFALVFFKLSGERIPPLALNLFKNALAVFLLSITLYVMWLFGRDDGFSVLGRHSIRDIMILLLSGFIGIALADTVFFHSLNLVGVGISAIVDCLYSPSVIFFSVLLLGESLGPWQIVGGVAVLSAILTASRLKPPRDRTHAQLVLGILLGAAAMGMMGFGIVIAKPIIEKMPLIWSTTIRLFAGSVSLSMIAACSRNRRVHFSAFIPSSVWKWSVPAAVLGAYISMLFWVAGFKYIDASIAGILNQTSSVFAIVLATLILKESFTLRKLFAIVLATIGVVMVAMNQPEKVKSEPPILVIEEKAALAIDLPRARLIEDFGSKDTGAAWPGSAPFQNSSSPVSSIALGSNSSLGAPANTGAD